MDLNYYTTFYNLPHKERLLLILMNSYKSELNACKNKTTQIYISKIYDDHIKILLSSDSVKTSTPNKIQHIPKNIPKPSISNITLLDLIDNESHQITDDNSLQLTNDNSPKLTNDHSLQITNDNSLQITNDNSPQLTNDNSPQLTNDNSPQLTNDNSPQLTNDESKENIDKSKKITNKYLSNIDDILNEFDIKYGAWEQEGEDDMF